ncbi:MAG: Phosphoglycerate kinase [Cryomorphaceae bacterium]|nr:MAG: Phosphoglycerate kinase [Cryomorphaceae bacterium]|tara:strand:- start:1934 stop:3124 length:1191 start_codon:yes stop_codon:yes gene_type:complete
MNNISDISLKGKKVLIRVDFNVPLDKHFNITDDSRIQAALPTIKKVISDGGKAIIMSHLGRPKNGFEEKFSLKHTLKHLSNLLEIEVGFSLDCIGKKTLKDISKMENGDVLVLENLRFYSQEKTGDNDFAKQLSKLGDVYVNDAFGTAHRAHASTSTIANYFPKNKYFGLLLNNEINNLETALKNPQRPFTAIIGGAKITGKIDVITSLYDKVDNLIIGGGMAYTFAKAMGGCIGDSLVENDKVALAKSLITQAKAKGVQLLLPSDSINANEFNNNAIIQHSEITNIPDGFMGLDIGNDSITRFSKVILDSKTIIWNGPMGVFEMDNFLNGTKKIGDAICKATKNGAFSLVGGGDSVAAVKQFGFTEKVSYISTGGGAMLEYLEGKKLPGVIAIQD